MTNMTSQKLVWNTIEELCDQAFGARPSPTNLATLKKIEGERAEVREFVERVFRLMALSRLDPKDIPPSLAWALAVLIPGLLPGAWGGLIPPWTFEDRHQLIDAYMAANPWVKLGPGTSLLEMGCGFPPLTALESSRAFPEWQVTGADPQMDPYVVHDASGNYACMNGRGEVRFFHTATSNFAVMTALYKDPTVTLRRFEKLFRSLITKLPPVNDGGCITVEQDGAKMIRNPMRGYEQPNLKLVQAGLGAELPCADIVRCFNVLIYFDAEFRSEAESWALRTLRPGGLFLCGGDIAKTMEARYSVYQNDNGRLIPKEFAFSIDNLRPLTVNPWYCIHEGEKEVWALAKLVGLIRSDPAFRRDFDTRLDGLLAENKIWVRQSDGYLAAPPSQLPTAEWTSARVAISAQLDRDGFVDRALFVLNRAGYKAWRNAVGHLAVDPATSITVPRVT